MVLLVNAVPRHARRQRRRIQNRRQVDALGLPVIAGQPRLQPVHASHHLVEGAEAQPRHVFAHLLGEEEEEVDHVLGLSGKARPQHRVLRRNAHRAGVQMALAHHDAAHRHQRRGGKAELLGSQQRRNHHVASGLQLAVGLHPNAAAQIVQQQHLLRLGQSQLPRNARVPDRAQRRCARAAAVAADQHHVGVRLGNAGGHRSHAHLGDQLHADARLRIHVLQVVDQLRQIFNRINIVVRRRRNQRHPRRRVPQLGDHLVHLVTRQLSALAGLGALRHLDLQLVGVHQVIRGHAKARRSHLLHRTAPQVARRVGLKARGSPRRPRPYCSARRCGSSQWPASRAPPC